jgi:phage-related holin
MSFFVILYLSTILKTNFIKHFNFNQLVFNNSYKIVYSLILSNISIIDQYTILALRVKNAIIHVVVFYFILLKTYYIAYLKNANKT